MSKDIVVVIGVDRTGLAIAGRLGGRVLLLADSDDAVLKASAEQLRREGHRVVARTVDPSDRASVAALADTAAGLGRVTHLAHVGCPPVADTAPTPAILTGKLLGPAVVLEEFGRVVAPGGAGVFIADAAAHLERPLPAEQQRALTAAPAAELLQLPFLAPEAVGDPRRALGLVGQVTTLRVRVAAVTTWNERGARANSVSSGVVATSAIQGTPNGPAPGVPRAPTGLSPVIARVGTAQDVADAASFLLGPQAAFITGTDVLVDGGAVAALRQGQL